MEALLGLPPPSRGEVRRIKVTDGPTVVGRGTCIPVCTEGGGARRGHQGLSTQTGEKPPVAYKPDKAPPESGGRAVRAL